MTQLAKETGTPKEADLLYDFSSFIFWLVGTCVFWELWYSHKSVVVVD